MEGFEPRSYGDAIADVYDEWYADVSDADETTERVAELAVAAGGGRVLELGVGTGRLALPLVARGMEVVGVDASPAMIERLRAKPHGHTIEVIVGDMVADLPDGPFAVILVAYNTLFSLPTADQQAACFASAARQLAPAGRLVIEAFVPDETAVDSGGRVEVRTLTADRVVLVVSRHDAEQQRADGQFVELTEAGGVRLRPWSLRYATPAELDGMAAAAGLVLDQRWSSWHQAPFTPDSTHHVSLYRRTDAPAT